MMLPMVLSPLAEIVPTWATSLSDLRGALQLRINAVVLPVDAALEVHGLRQRPQLAQARVDRSPERER